MSYEETALRGELTEAQVEKILDAFAKQSTPKQVALEADVPVELVRELLTDPLIAVRALERKKALVGVWVAGQIMDVLVGAMTTAGHPSQQLSAAQTLVKMLGLDQQVKTNKKSAPTKASAGGALEQAVAKARGR